MTHDEQPKPAPDVSVVYREDAHGEGRYDRWVGLRIGEIVQWYAHTDCYSADAQYAAVETQLHTIARAVRRAADACERVAKLHAQAVKANRIMTELAKTNGRAMRALARRSPKHHVWSGDKCLLCHARREQIRVGRYTYWTPDGVSAERAPECER